MFQYKVSIPRSESLANHRYLMILSKKISLLKFMLKVVGSGLGRTGTKSLKLALERLLGEPCYHFTEILFFRPEHIPLWVSAARGESIHWSVVFDGCIATWDWPSSAFWLELSTIYPDSLIILSHRDADSWWKSASSTIFSKKGETEGELRSLINELFKNRFTLDLTNRSVCIEAFNKHNERVRNAGLGSRLLEWNCEEG